MAEQMQKRLEGDETRDIDRGQIERSLVGYERTGMAAVESRDVMVSNIDFKEITLAVCAK